MSAGSVTPAQPASQKPKTTTISTIAVQSGATRIVVALLQSKESLELQVLEMSPDMTRLGDDYVISSDLLMAHQDVLRKLQSKQSPVEELLKQADQLIASQRPRAEVYAAMAESLGQAWKDLNAFLEQRRIILEYNVSFHSHGEDVIDKLTSLDRETLGAQQQLPNDVDSVKRLRSRLDESRKSALESLRLALLDGEVLTEKLTAMKNIGTLDSRPGHIQPAAEAALCQVKRWLEALHDRRRRSEMAYKKRRSLLDQWIEICSLRKELTSADKKLDALGRDGSSALGESTATAEMLLFEHNKRAPERKELQEKTLHLTHQAEGVHQAGIQGSEQVRREAYALLDKTSEYLEGEDQRAQLLEQTIHFFRVASAALTKLDQLEVQLTAHQASPGSAQLAQLHAQVSRALEDATAPALHHGYGLLDTVGRSHPGAEGIRRTVELIENRGIQLGSMCTAHKEESIRIVQAVRSFIEQYELVYSWLVEVVEAFLRSQTDMKGTLPEARQVLDIHTQLENDLTVRGSEIDALLRSVNPLCEKAEEAQAHEVQMKADHLHDTWQRLRNMLGDRVELMQSYVRVHHLAMQVQEAWDDVEAKCQGLDADSDQETSTAVRQVEELWLNGQQKYVQLCQLGNNFMADALKISDRHLDVRKACLCVESLLEYLGGRQLAVHRMQETFVQTVTNVTQTRKEWTQFVAIIQSVMHLREEKENSLYPMLPPNADPPCSSMIRLMEERSSRVVSDVTGCLNRLDAQKAEAERIKLGTGQQEERSRLLGELSLQQQRLQFRLKEYKTLMQMALGMFNNLNEVETMTEILDQRVDQRPAYRSVQEVDAAIKDHQVARNTVNELLKITRQEANQLVALLEEQEPPGVAHPDIQLIGSYLERSEKQWERSWKAEEARLGRQRQRCQFNDDLHAIHVQLDELSRQLAAMNQQGVQYGSSLAAARLTSQAFLQFEKTIGLLEVRIGTFFSTARQMLAEEGPQGSDLQKEMDQINLKWSSFHQEVGDTRQRIDLSIDYFTLADEVDESFRRGGQLLVGVARKSAQVRTPEDARALIKEVDDYIKPQEAQIEEKTRKMSQLAVKLYGQESPSRIHSALKENRNMLDSFAVIKTELSTLAVNLQAVQQERQKQAQTQAAVQESLEAAKAEAAAARAAASAADEARKAAEAAALAMKEDWNVARQQAQQHSQPPPRPPPPAEVAVQGRPAPPLRTKASEALPEGPTFVQLLQDTTVEEGKAVQFTCKVTGRPAPAINWLKDGLSIGNNPDYQTTYDLNKDGSVSLSLTIDETFVDDSARFTCQASNTAGFTQTSALLKVQAEDRLVPPEFVEPLIDSTAREGQSHQLKCRVAGVPLPDVSWFKNGQCVDHCRDYSIACNDGLCTLDFAHVFVEDDAVFECRAVNEAGEADTAARLTVEPLEPTEVPSFNPGLSSSVMARTGQKVRLECTLAGGLPQPTIHWLHNNKPIKETRDIKTLMESGNKVLLTITEAFPKDAGTYTAVARNAAGEATTSCNLVVKGKLPADTSDSELASDMEPVKPCIQQALPATMTVNEGQQVRLDCVIVAQPEPEVIWYQNGRPVKESSDFQLIFQGDRCSLVIREAFQEDSGAYRVVAVNSAGEASSQCQLNVTAPYAAPAEEGAVTQALISLTAVLTEPPVFTKIFGNVHAQEGGPVVLDCVINGKPVPKVLWYHNDQPIGIPGAAAANVVASKMGEYQYQLSVDKVRPEQAGRYKCVAESDAGVATCLAHVTVRPAIQLDEGCSFVSKKAVFSQSSTVFSSSDSSQYKSVTVQQSVTKVVTEEADASEMSVKQRASLFGGPSTEPTSPKVKKPVQQARRAVAPRFVAPLTGSMVEPGAHVELEGILDGHPLPDIKWYKNGVELPDQLPDRIKTAYANQKVHLTISGVEEADAGRYTCTARNAGGTASSTADVVIRRTQFPPVFGRRLQAQTVRIGSRVTMEVEVTGTPTPEVFWFKDDSPLNTSANLSIKSDGNRHRVVVGKVTEADAGRYTVRAVNRAGEALSTAELLVSQMTAEESPPLARRHPPLKVDVTAHILRPEPPPEVLFAPKSESPKTGSTSSGRIDFAEKTRILEEASKNVTPTEVPGGIRLLPLPVTEAPSKTVQPPDAVVAAAPTLAHTATIELSAFEPFPELEPFPFKPDPPVVKEKKPATSLRRPGKFVRGESRESDYESDFEGAKIRPKWTPAGSDAEETSYKKVQVKLDERSTSRTVTKEPTPPTEFDVPPRMDGPPRPTVLTEGVVSAIIQAKAENGLKAQPAAVTIPPPAVVKPSFADLPQPTARPAVTVSAGSFTSRKPSQKALEMEKQWSHRFVTSQTSKIWPPVAAQDDSRPIWTGKCEVSSSPSFDSHSTALHSHTGQRETVRRAEAAAEPEPMRSTPPSLEPFPFRADPPAEKRKSETVATVRQPGKFVRGEFAESDYCDVSDTDSARIAPRWAPPDSDQEEPAYKKVQSPAVILKPSFPKDKTPSPPSKYDANPPQFDGPPRPEFQPLPPQQFQRKPSMTGVETTQRMQMEESTRFSKRFVTVEQTSRVVQFQQPSVESTVAVAARPTQSFMELEPFPFVPDPPQPAKTCSPMTTSLKRPSKFVPGGWTNESDYESDYEGAKIRPKWVPAGSDAEEPRYRVVQPPSSASGGRKEATATGGRTPTPPTVFDQPPSFDGPPRPVISPTEASRIKAALFGVDDEAPIVKPVAIRPSQYAQEKAASHFNQMSSAFRDKAQNFAQQVIADVQAKPIQQPSPQIPTVMEPTGSSEPQAYHEESRASEFGTKHIDPDTGLIYFKYDFGYEFGLVLPGQPQKVDKIESSIGKEGTIELPVIHERTTPTPDRQTSGATAGQPKPGER